MDALERTIEQAVGIILFAIAVVLLLAGTKRITETAKTVAANKMSDNDIAFESNADVKEPEITYAQLIATLSGRLEYDVWVDDVMITADTYSPSQLSAYPIPKWPHYKKEIRFNTDGTVDCIVFRGY